VSRSSACVTRGLDHASRIDAAQALLRSRYPQLAAMEIARLAVIAVRIERTTSWGDLSVG
jgi:hypothetical protein